MANRIPIYFAVILTIMLCFVSMSFIGRYREHAVLQFASRAKFVGRITVDWRSLADPQDPINCITTQISNIAQIPICTYRADEDAPISSEFLSGKYYAMPDVTRMLALLRRYNETTFVDLGANIGTFTLPAARLTSVVAVEPSRRTMARLAKSVELGNVRGNVTLVNNAISNSRESISIIIGKGNLGGNTLAQERNCLNSSASCIHAILLDDLLPLVRTKNVIMKVDVEGHEAIAFNDETASKFFSQLDIKLVFMEWFVVIRRPDDQIESLLSFFISRKYVVVDPKKPEGTNRLSILHYRTWPFDVLFVKPGFKP